METQQDFESLVNKINSGVSRLTLSVRGTLEAKKCFDWTEEGAGGSARVRNKMKMCAKSESEVSAGRVCYKMDIYLKSESEKKVMISKCIEKVRVKRK